MAKRFRLQGVDGKTYKLSDFKGKKVYLKSLGFWCSICLSTLEIPMIWPRSSQEKIMLSLSVVSPTF